MNNGNARARGGWLHGLKLEPVECYLRIMTPLKDEIRRLSLEPKRLARDEEDARSKKCAVLKRIVKTT